MAGTECGEKVGKMESRGSFEPHFGTPRLKSLPFLCICAQFQEELSKKWTSCFFSTTDSTARFSLHFVRFRTLFLGGGKGRRGEVVMAFSNLPSLRVHQNRIFDLIVIPNMQRDGMKCRTKVPGKNNVVCPLLEQILRSE